ncbi:hypothetical protein JB92DRAFT_1024633 [Gautieria morchelliformis]|nr:hypothetical protein JB92DRAFT_1024633 [Gautieria morchelliformis]
MVELTEREIPLIQRGIIDNCFEEGQYEYGMDVLDKLRAQGYKPPPLHIRQLLYISLYPPPRPKCAERVDVFLSPQKAQIQRQKQDLWPKPGSRPLAIALLNAFIHTNSPECLTRGLPYHSYIDNNGVKDVDPFGQEKPLSEPEDHSPMRSELPKMQTLKDCWGLLKGGLVKRKKWDRSQLVDEEPMEPENAIVGRYAWPVLEWLLQVFEKDERRERENSPPYSALLLCQIPQPRSRSGPRWDVEQPLQVAFTCFSIRDDLDPKNLYASAKTRWDLGLRFISLLVNLTLTRPALLLPTVFLSSLTTRLFDLPIPPLLAFFSTIPTTQTLFKISVLDRYISTGNSNGTSTQKSGAAAPRPRPKFTGRGTADDVSAETATPDKYKDPYPLPSRDSLLNLLSSPLRGPSTSDSEELFPSSLPLPRVKVAFAKFHLISALCSLHLSRQLVDSEWTTAVTEGKLRQCVLDGFASGGNAPMGGNMVVDGESGQETDEQKVRGCMKSALEMVKVWETTV